MDLKAIIAAANSVAKPKSYKLGEHTVYIRRMTTHDNEAFVEAMKRENANTSKHWVVAFGLCDEKGTRVFENADEGVDALKDLMIEDLVALEKCVLIELGFEDEAAKKA